MQELIVYVDGRIQSPELSSAPYLVRAVIISLFTWRRANPDDELPGDQRMGWWGDNYLPNQNDKIGSRLWLLARAKITEKTIVEAQEYANEALQWMVEDGVAARVDVIAERQGLETIALSCALYKSDGSKLIDVRFSNFWDYLNV